MGGHEGILDDSVFRSHLPKFENSTRLLIGDVTKELPSDLSRPRWPTKVDRTTKTLAEWDFPCKEHHNVVDENHVVQGCDELILTCLLKVGANLKQCITNTVALR